VVGVVPLTLRMCKLPSLAVTNSLSPPCETTTAFPCRNVGTVDPEVLFKENVQRRLGVARNSAVADPRIQNANREYSDIFTVVACQLFWYHVPLPGAILQHKYKYHKRKKKFDLGSVSRSNNTSHPNTSTCPVVEVVWWSLSFNYSKCREDGDSVSQVYPFSLAKPRVTEQSCVRLESI